MNQTQMEQMWMKLLAAGGPIAALLMNRFGLDQTTTTAILEVLLVVVPPIGAGIWAWFKSRDQALVQAVAAMPAPAVNEALAKVSDMAKVQVAEAVPGVATVVIKDEANGSLATLAANPNHPNVVTETQNEADAKLGTKV